MIQSGNYWYSSIKLMRKNSYQKITITAIQIIYIYTNVSTRAGCNTRSTKAKENSLPYYLPIAGGRIIGFIPFPRVLVLCGMQSTSSNIWTSIAVSISYNDNHYTMRTSQIYMYIYMNMCVILSSTSVYESNHLFTTHTYIYVCIRYKM